MTDVAYTYSPSQAVEDGIYAPVLQRIWDKLTHGKPIYATMGVFEMELSEAAYIEIWNDFVRYILKGGKDYNFTTKMNGKIIRVGNNGDSYAMFLPEED